MTEAAAITLKMDLQAVVRIMDRSNRLAAARQAAEASLAGPVVETTELGADGQPRRSGRIVGRGAHRVDTRGPRDNPPTLFESFCRLPPELRIMIWKHFCPSLTSETEVLQVHLKRCGNLCALPTVRLQTRTMRRMLAVCAESRALALARVPDELVLGLCHGKPIRSHTSITSSIVVRFHAHRDIVHILGEEKPDDDVTTYPHVRNLALVDRETRTHVPEPVPGVPLASPAQMSAPPDLNLPGHGPVDPPTPALDFITGMPLTVEDDDNENNDEDEEPLELPLSHRRPSEMRPPPFGLQMAAMFPGLEHLYVSEPGAVRPLDQWVGDARHGEFWGQSYERVCGIGLDLAFAHVYCWVPAGRGLVDRAVINIVSSLIERGVTVQRLLYYEMMDGMRAYRQMRKLCQGGEWPRETAQEPLPMMSERAYQEGEEEEEEDEDLYAYNSQDED